MNCNDDNFYSSVPKEAISKTTSERTVTTGAANITIIQNRIVFENEGDFNIVNSYLNDAIANRNDSFENPYTSNDVLNEWESDIGFLSYRSDFIQNTSADAKYFDIDNLPINEPVLSSMLNPHRIFQVTPWILKMNPNTREVFALNVANKHLLPILESQDDFSDYPEIRAYSFDESVFESIANEGVEIQNWPYLQRYARNKNDPTVGDPYCTSTAAPGDVRYEVEVRYSRWGIIENLYIGLKHRDSQSWNHTDDRTAYDFSFSSTYTPRCENTVQYDKNFSGGCDFLSTRLPLIGGRNARHVICSKSKALAAYFVSGRARFWSRCSGYPAYIGGGRLGDPALNLGFCVNENQIVTSNTVIISDN